MKSSDGSRHTASVSPDAVTLERATFLPKRTMAISVLSIVGIGVSAYLSYEHFAGGQYFCAGLGDCSYVNTSSYAMIAGVPVALLGLLAYAGILVAAIASARGSGSLGLTVAPLTTFGLALGGILFSAYLTYVELFILRTI